MRIAQLHVSRYRRLKDINLSFSDGVTVLAGANNSGKTSLVELLCVLFGDAKRSFTTHDLPIEEFTGWKLGIWAELSHYLADTFLGGNLDVSTLRGGVSGILFGDGTNPPSSPSPSMEVQLTVSYSRDADDIRKFADYFMDLDENDTRFYFCMKYELDKDMTGKRLGNYAEQFLMRLRTVCEATSLDDAAALQEKEAQLSEVICGDAHLCKYLFDNIVCPAFRSTYWFCDPDFTVMEPMTDVEFRVLFHFTHIEADRNLDDEGGDAGHRLSSSAFRSAVGNGKWDTTFQRLVREITSVVDNADTAAQIQQSSIAAMVDALSQISRTNGGDQDADKLSLHVDVNERNVGNFLRIATQAVYDVGNANLGEGSQGLGYSNLIYILLELMKFRGEEDSQKVNFFVVEEPESHMHPQMQSVFIRYLLNEYSNVDSNTSGLVTTHSAEVVARSELRHLRVLRPGGAHGSKVFDLRDLCSSQVGSNDIERRRLYNLLFGLNLADIVFADRAILYEGDTERMLIRYVLDRAERDACQESEYGDLGQRYISYMQVGGAYAHRYFDLLRFLEIKSLVITDIDYCKELVSIDKIKGSPTTNATLKTLPGLGGSPSAGELYKLQSKSGGVVEAGTGLIGVVFQGEEDGYTRTLEEAMLARRFGVSIEEKKTRDEWENLREGTDEQAELLYAVPRSQESGGGLSLRDIENSTSGSKTDFMYSVLLRCEADSDNIDKFVPHYIEDGLKWLAK